MSLEIVYKQSAFKHGVTASDILWAFNTAKYDRLVEGFDNKYLLLGFSTHGSMLEVMYNDLGEDRVSAVPECAAFITGAIGAMYD
jgi:hypothetical protein